MTPERLLERVEELTVEAKAAADRLPFWELTATLHDAERGFDLVLYQADSEDELARLSAEGSLGEPEAEYLMRDWTGWDMVPDFLGGIRITPLSNRVGVSGTASIQP